MKKLMLLFSLILTLASHAQDKVTVSGTITSKDDSRPLEGINVVLASDSKVGTTTNQQGKFTLVIPSNGTLVISGIGYTTQEVKPGNRTTLAIQLETNTMNLDDVVVIGFGTQSRRTVTGSVSKISGENLTNVASANFQNTLQGMAPGINVTGTSGLAGSPVRIRIRGSGSIFSNGEPLYVIDGVPVESDNSGLFGTTGRGGAPPANPMANIDADEIESVEILKDAAASAIYGARAANGVVLITTKRGKSGKTRFAANVSYGITNPTNKVEYLNGDEYMRLRMEAIQNARNTGITFNGNLGGVPAIYLNGGYNQWFANAVPALAFDSTIAAQVASQNLNHFDDVFRQGATYAAGVSASGGNDKTQFFTSLNYNNEKGFLQRNDFQRISGRINIDHTASQQLKLGVQVNGSYTKNSLLPIGNPSLFAGGFNAGGFFNATNSILPIFPKTNQDGTLFGVPQGVNNIIFQNEDLFNSTVDNQRYLTNVYADLKIIKSLSFRTEIGNDYISQINRFYMNPLLTPGGAQGTQQGVNDFRTRISNTINANNYFTFKKTFDAQHNVDLVAGNQYTYNNNRSSFIQSNLIPAAPTLNTTQVAGQATSQDRLDQFTYMSFFGRLNYNYKRRYLLGASLRTDGSSRFGANNRWATFPSLSAGWVISDEAFMPKKDFVSLLKLRASWGLTGNSNPGGVEAISYGGFGVGNAFYGGSIGFPYRRIEELANNIRWERTEMIDLALDFGFFQNRLSGSFNYYQRNTTDLILGATPPPTAGIFGGRNYRNSGSLKNWGYEIAISGKIIDNKRFRWTVDVNAAYNQNEVTSLGGLDPSAVSYGVNRVFVGMPLSTYYLPLYLGVDPTTGFEVFADVAKKTDGTPLLDGNGQRTHDPTKRIIVDPFGRIAGTTTNINWDAISAPVEGKPGMPVWTGGITNTVGYKGFTLSAMLTFNLGNWIYDAGAQSQAYMLQVNRNVRKEFYDGRWTGAGQNATNPGIFFNPVYSGQATSRFLYNGDYARLRNLRLSYDLPKSLLNRMQLTRATVFVNATNLLTFTNFKGWDPEVSGTISFQDFNNQPQNIAASQTNADPPQARNIAFGVQLNF